VRHRVVIGILCRRVKIFTFQLTANIRLWKEGGASNPEELSWTDSKFSKAASFYRSFC